MQGLINEGKSDGKQKFHQWIDKVQVDIRVAHQYSISNTLIIVNKR